MKKHRVIIVGGGPAGAACAWKLVQAGVDCLLLDKKTFPELEVQITTKEILILILN